MNIEIKNTLLLPQARSFVLIGVFAVMFLILAARVFYLQIIKGEEYAENFRLQIKREITLHGTRGNIYDKNGKLLAGNKIVYKKSGIELTESSPQVTDSYAIPSAIGQGTNNFSTVQLGRANRERLRSRGQDRTTDCSSAMPRQMSRRSRWRSGSLTDMKRAAQWNAEEKSLSHILMSASRQNRRMLRDKL